MEGVGAGQRVIAQMALQRAPDSWIAPDIRKAVEHPLQEERDAAAASLKGAKGAGATSDTAEGLKIVLLLAGLVATALVLGTGADNAERRKDRLGLSRSNRAV
jgi:hypothetical protein